MITRAGDTIWAMSANVGGMSRDEIAQRQHAWKLRGEPPVLPTRKPEPAEPSVASALDKEYDRHQRRFGDIALSRDEWDNRVQSHLNNPVRPSGAYIARSPYALVGHDAASGMIRALGNGALDKMRKHYEMGSI